jgi:hypothetical protein
VAKALYLSSQNTVHCYKSFCLGSKFLITNTAFFPSWNICSIIPLVSITYLALVHNYNTIKCICFISPRQCTGMSSRLWYCRFVLLFFSTCLFKLSHCCSGVIIYNFSSIIVFHLLEPHVFSMSDAHYFF